jgi:hypothetical protein
MLKYGTALMSCALTVACASTQLNFNTLDIAASVSDLYARQVLENLSRTIDDPTALPSQLDLSGGVVQTNFTVTPSANSPLSRSVARGASGAVTSTTLPNAGATLSVSDSAQQNWSVVPVSDSNSLRNLRALYRYAVGAGNLNDYSPPFSVNSKGQKVYDSFFISPPHCVRCGPNLKINVKLDFPGWLYWRTDIGVAVPEHLPPADEPVVDLGHFGHHSLMVLTRQYEDFNNFVLFTMPTVKPDAGAAKNPGPRTPSRGPFLVPPVNQPLAAPPQ